MQHMHLLREPNLALKYKAFPYQETAAKTICDLEYAAIFHEQGLGKSKIAIDVMLYWLEKKYVDTVLVIVKKTLVHNWIKEFKTHTFIKPRILVQNQRVNYDVFNSPARLIIAHYEVIRSEKERFRLFTQGRDVAIVLDESAKIKNPYAALTRDLFELAPLFKKRIIMTGTSVANRPFDIWAQIFFLDSGHSLGTDFERFKAETDFDPAYTFDPKKRASFERRIASIHSKITSFAVRELKSSGIIELPEKKYQTIKTTWEPRQFELYKCIRENFKAIVLKDGIPKEENADDLLKRMLRLVQITSNPRLVDHSYNFEPGKTPFLMDLVSEIVSKQEKCIIWTSFVDNVEAIAKDLKTYGVRKVHGKMAIADRNKGIDDFISNKNAAVLVATPGSAKEGLTLTAANHAIFYDRGFSLDDYTQAQDRIHRISQRKTCFIYNMIMQDSIDEWIDELIEAKSLAAKLVQGDISIEEYQSKISYSFSEIIKEILMIK